MFSYEALDHARAARKGIVQKVAELKAAAAPAAEPSEEARKYMADFDSAMENDLSAPQALSVLHLLLKSSVSPADKLAAIYHMDGILGLDLEGVAPYKEEKIGGDEEWALVEERAKAKKERNYQRADEIRAELLKRGYIVKDTPSGPVLEKNV